jgi:GT2 family glycosyltransferase
MDRNLTIILPSYRSKKLILSHLKFLSKNYKIIVIENSYDTSLEKIIKSKYKNVEIYLKKNIGYGRAVNFAARKVKTKFFFVMNPDAKIYKNTLKNLIKYSKKIKNFGAIGPIYINKKKEFKENIILETKKIIAAAMLVETKIFRSIKGFDENFFLYYEDDDYFEKCNSLKLKLYHITNSFISHKKIKKIKKTLNLHSTTFSNIEEKNSTYIVGGWHGQWSKFYYFKKYKGILSALIICLPNIIINLIQIVPYFFYNPIKAKYKYFKIEGFFCSLLGLPSFKRSKFDKKYLL